MENKTIRKFSEEIRTITTDNDFERPYGCWSNKQKNEFIETIYTGLPMGIIILVNLRKCLNYSQKKGDQISVNYYQRLIAKGYEYLSLDGKHRTKAIQDFIEGKFAYTGETRDLKNVTHKVKNKFWKDLSSEQQLIFETKFINIEEIDELLHSDLSVAFRRLNNSTPISPQQRRNSFQTPFAKWTRDLASTHSEKGEFKKLFIDLFGNEKISLMEPEETITKMYMHAKNPMDKISKLTMDALYEKGKGKLFDQVYCAKSQQVVEESLQILKDLDKDGIPKNKKILFILSSIFLAQNKLELSDNSKFIKELAKLDDDLANLSQEKRTNDLKKNKEIIENEYYHEQARNNWSGSSERMKTVGDHIKIDLNKFGLKRIVEDEDQEMIAK